VLFRVNGYGDQKFTGKVKRIDPAANDVTRQVEVLVGSPAAQPRVAGLYAEGRIDAEQSTLDDAAGKRAGARRRQDLCLARQGRQAGQGADLTIGTRDRAPATSRCKTGLAAGDMVLRVPAART
jgi:membrane fusion protein (multidrug efflux system)